MGGIFDGESGPEMMAETESRRCKPDYEKLIGSQRTKNIASNNLRNAILDYLDNHGLTSRRSNEFTLTSLLGALELEIRYGMINVDKLIKQQEQDKDS
jgi:hypothetical protein